MNRINKIALIPAALIAVLASQVALAAAPVTTGQITLTGTVTKASCQLNIANPTVDLGTYYAGTTFKTVGSTSPAKPLGITISDCGGTVAGLVKLTGAPSDDAQYFVANDTNSGLGIKLDQNGTTIKPNDTANFTADGDLQLNAAFISTQALELIKTTQANTIINFEITNQ